MLGIILYAYLLPAYLLWWGFVQIFLNCFFLSFCWVLAFLCIFCIEVLLQMCFPDIFSYFVSCLFFLLTVFHRTDILNFKKVISNFSLLLTGCRFSFVFSSMIFTGLHLKIYVYGLFSVSFYISRKVGVYIFPYGFQLFYCHLWNRLSFFCWLAFVHLASHLSIFRWVYSFALFFLFHLSISSPPISYSFHYCSFIISVWIWMCELTLSFSLLTCSVGLETVCQIFFLTWKFGIPLNL